MFWIDRVRLAVEFHFVVENEMHTVRAHAHEMDGMTRVRAEIRNEPVER